MNGGAVRGKVHIERAMDKTYREEISMQLWYIICGNMILLLRKAVQELPCAAGYSRAIILVGDNLRRHNEMFILLISS